MPWHVEQRGNQFAVVANDGGKVMGTHATKPQAVAQLKALYANVPEASEGEAGGAADADRGQEGEEMSARDHARNMRSGGPTGMMKKSKKKKGGGKGYMNPPMQPVPPGPQDKP